MSATRGYRLTERAEIDLDQALLWSYEILGEYQALKYAALFDRAAMTLAQFPLIGRSRHDLLPGMRSWPVGKHLLFYVVLDGEIVTLRIAHHRRRLDDLIFEE